MVPTDGDTPRIKARVRYRAKISFMVVYKKVARCKKIAGDTSSFPSGPPPQYSSRLKLFNFGVRMGSGAFSLVWPTANTYLA